MSARPSSVARGAAGKCGRGGYSQRASCAVVGSGRGVGSRTANTHAEARDHRLGWGEGKEERKEEVDSRGKHQSSLQELDSYLIHQSSIPSTREHQRGVYRGSGSLIVGLHLRRSRCLWISSGLGSWLYDRWDD
jgi:hypothetical protein